MEPRLQEWEKLESWWVLIVTRVKITKFEPKEASFIWDLYNHLVYIIGQSNCQVSGEESTLLGAQATIPK